MRRPTRTRRLSIAAIVSLLLFAAVAVPGIRSFWTWEVWSNHNGRLVIALVRGRVAYLRASEAVTQLVPPGYSSYKSSPDWDSVRVSLCGFQIDSDTGYHSRDQKLFMMHLPIWPLLLLLLIVPVRWLVAHPANAPAFPVIADAKRA